MSMPLRVLIIEDSEDACLLIVGLLEKQGYDITWRRVETAPAMRQSLTDQPWDVIVADYVVPGFDALASLKVAQELAPDLPFIVASGNLGEEVAVAIMKAGAHDYVTKSNLARLVPAIERELREAESRRARRQAEATLRQKEILGRAVLDSLPAGIAVLEHDGTIVATNAVWEGLTQGQTKTGSATVSGRYEDLFQRTPLAGGKNKLLSGIRSVLDGSLTNFTCEYSRQGPSGTRWLLLQASPLHDSGGALISQTDVTESKRAEEALGHSEARFRDVVESLGEGLLLTDPDDMIWYANSRMGQLTGCDPSEMIERPVSAYFEALENSGERSLGAAALRSERAELELVCKSGQTLWTEVNAASLRDSQGHVIGTVRAITDITERRQAREALRKSQAGLLLAQRIGHVGSWELDLSTSAMDWSSETYRILDVKTDVSRPTLPQFLDLLHPADQSRVRQALDNAVQARSACRVDCRVARLDGTERFIHLQAQVILDSQEKATQVIGTVQDITERKQLEEQLRQSQKMEAVGKLAGGIAHDFNNILTVIQGYTELICCQAELDDQTRAYANQISGSAERASRLTRQLLAFSRKQLMQLKTLDLNELLKNLSPMLQRLLGEQSELVLNLQGDLPPVTADSGMMEQVLVNLAVNARDAMPKGGRLIIETSFHQIEAEYCRIHADAAPGQFICLGVIDTGHGMDANTLSHVFEPFFTTKEVGRGTGLGLSTVYGIVKQHQGWIQVASEVGQGTAFKVFLPSSVPSAASAPRPIQNVSVATGNETILLVEDEPPLRQLARSILERSGYRVFEAGSGPEAIEAWQKSGKIDLVLTDMVMPGGMTGRELAVQLQKQAPDLRVLYTSGYSLDFVESDLFLREGVNFVPKPYSATALIKAVRTCLDRKI